MQMHYIAEGDVVLGRGMKGSRISSGRPLSENREESGWNTAKPIAAGASYAAFCSFFCFFACLN